MRALLLLFLLAIAQPAAAAEKVWRVGLLSNSPPPGTGGATNWRDEILQVLVQNGFRVGRNLEIVERYSEGQYDRLPTLAREINSVGVDIVVAVTDASVRAVLAATKTTPVVMVVGYDPVASGASRTAAAGSRALSSRRRRVTQSAFSC